MTRTPTATEGRKTQIMGGKSERVPSLPLVVKDAQATRELMFTLRHFYLGDPAAKEKLERPAEDLLPALLDTFRDTSRLRYHYPLILFAPEPNNDAQGPEELVQPFSEWIKGATTSFAPGEEAARILKDHLPWIERWIRHQLHQIEGPTDAARLLGEVPGALQEHLGLDQPSRQRLGEDLSRLEAAVPKGSQLLWYGRYSALHLMVHAIRSRAIPRRARFRTEITRCIEGLKGLLEVEWSKSDESIEPRMARDSVGPAGTWFDPLALSAVMDHSRGSRAMSPERRARIEKALETLINWREYPVLVHFVHGSSLVCDWMQGDPTLLERTEDDPCIRATELFDRQAEELAEVFAAARIAQLEIERKYDPVIHDPWFANFTWEGFSREELLLVPTVLAVESAERVAGEGMQSFSRLLSSGRPVQILIRVQPSNNPGAHPKEGPFHSYRSELGFAGISHRQAVVVQSSAARHHHLLEGFLTALDATRTSLHLINTGLRPSSNLVPLNAWLVAGAAIEGRAHPFFRINPEAGDSFALRMSFDGNPQPEADWPVHPFHYRDENSTDVTADLAFTFADYSLLIKQLREHYRLIPPGCDSESLVPMQDYLAMDQAQAYRLVPFIWAVDESATLHRLVVSRELALACLDRLNYWHTLQEMAGVRNRYVELAVEQTREEERRRAKQEQEQLQAEHAAKVEEVRSSAAYEAMQRLADVLLGMDQGMVIPMATSPRPAVTPGREAPVERPPEGGAEPEAEDLLSFDDPWIDTPLCTSCNDCMKINPLLFIYNDEKQAKLGDLSTATFAQLVQAAEKCPAKCIHPGKPMNPNEPGLGRLIERAAPFNQ